MTRLFRLVRMSLTVPLFLSLSAAFPRQEAAPQQEFPRGEVVDKVVCRADIDQSYALYLPSAYDKGRAWPIMYCFDPRANGKNPVACLCEAAEAPSIAVNPRRAFYLACAETLKAAAGELNVNKSKSAAALYEIATIIRPEAPAAWYKPAWIYAQSGETKKALAALGKSLADGRVDAEVIEQDPDFAPLRKEAAYARIMEDARLRRSAEKK
jgi:tetratricopeptide (TPR) repeat protein